jgi:hypothetical protein
MKTAPRKKRTQVAPKRSGKSIAQDYRELLYLREAVQKAEKKLSSREPDSYGLGDGSFGPKRPPHFH